MKIIVMKVIVLKTQYSIIIARINVRTLSHLMCLEYEQSLIA